MAKTINKPKMVLHNKCNEGYLIRDNIIFDKKITCLLCVL